MASWLIRIAVSSGCSSRRRSAICCGLHAIPHRRFCRGPCRRPFQGTAGPGTAAPPGTATGGFDVRIELAALILGEPDADQVAREVVLARQPVEGRAGGVLLHDLLLEREAVDAMTGHEPYSCKAQLPGQSSAIVVSDLRAHSTPAILGAAEIQTAGPNVCFTGPS